MKVFRSHKQLVPDGLFVERNGGVSPSISDIFGRRSCTLKTVLCGLPEEEYQAVRDKVWFFVPPDGAIGWSGPLPPNKQEILYLAPCLEAYTMDDLVLVVAHEIAHSLLGHATPSSLSELEKEDEAWRKVQQLGFGSESQILDFRDRTTQIAEG